MTITAIATEQWRPVGTEGIRVRMDGQDLPIVVLWSDGRTDTHTIRTLCNILAAQASGSGQRIVENAYVRRGNDLHEACIWTCAEDDGVTVVEIDVSSQLAAAGSYPTPAGR